MGFSATDAIIMAMAAAGTAYSMSNVPGMPQLPKMPQSAKSPALDVGSLRNSLTGKGQAGGAAGVAQTFLTGTQGIDPGLLNLGRNTLLGGGG